MPRFNRRAREWAAANGKPVSAGTDAHTLAEVGQAWTEVPDGRVESPDDLRALLSNGEIRGAWRQPLIAYVEKAWSRIRGDS
ncbi:MAG: PHP-associated domain-containing protein [Trueperaceae bacterium]|nr:PHP-associated domain-containing protein [Trueperaceae bacterium]